MGKYFVILILALGLNACTVFTSPRRMDIAFDDQIEQSAFINGEEVFDDYWPENTPRWEPFQVETYQDGHKANYSIVHKARINGGVFANLLVLPFFPLEFISPHNTQYPKRVPIKSGTPLPELRSDSLGFYVSNFEMDTALFTQTEWFNNIRAFRNGKEPKLRDLPEDFQWDMYYTGSRGRGVLNDLLMEYGQLNPDQYFWNQHANFSMNVAIDTLELETINYRESKVDWYRLIARVHVTVTAPTNAVVFDEVVTGISGQFISSVKYHYPMWDALGEAMISVINTVNEEGSIAPETRLTQSVGSVPFEESTAGLTASDLPELVLNVPSIWDYKGIALPVSTAGKVVMDLSTYLNRASDTLFRKSAPVATMGDVLRLPSHQLVVVDTDLETPEHAGLGSTVEPRETDAYYIVGQLWNSGNLFFSELDFAAIRTWDGWSVAQLDGSFDFIRNPLVLDGNLNVIGCVTHDVQDFGISGISFSNLLTSP